MELLPKKSGIYCIENKKNNMKYVGQSLDIKKRIIRHHIYDYKSEKSSEYNTTLGKAIRKHGIENFKVYVLELCNPKELDEKEIFWIKKLNTYKNGYNSTPGGKILPDNIQNTDIINKRKEKVICNESLNGENHPRAKLTNDEVIRIRQRYINGESCKEIYDDYKQIYLNFETFKRIIFGKSYKSVGNIPPKKDIRYTNKGKSTGKLKKEDIENIFSLRKEGLSYPQIAKKTGVSISSVWRICTYKSYLNIK